MSSAALFDFKASAETMIACLSLIERAARGEIRAGRINRNKLNFVGKIPCYKKKKL